MRSAIIGLDWGMKRWGLAKAYLDFDICLPIITLESGDLFDQLLQIIIEENSRWLVIGYPYNMDGTKSKNCLAIDQLKTRYESHGIRVDLWDERLSSERAIENLLEQGMKGKRKKERLDSQAAMVMLQEFVNQLKAKSK